MDSSSYASATGRVRLQSRTHSHCRSYKTGGSLLEAEWAVVAPKDCQWFANHFGSSGCRLVLQSSCADYVTRHGPRITVGLTHRLEHSSATSTVQLYMRAWHSRHSTLPGLNMGAEQAGDHLGKSPVDLIETSRIPVRSAAACFTAPKPTAAWPWQSREGLGPMISKHRDICRPSPASHRSGSRCRSGWFAAS